MSTQTIDHVTLAKLVEAGAVRAAHVTGRPGGWGVMVKHGRIERPLAAQRGKARLFAKLDTVVAYLKGIGIARFDVDAAHYDASRARRARPDRAAALKQAHEAAAYDKWFRNQVQAALDDPRPAIPHEAVAARWESKRAQLLKKVRARNGAKD